MIALEIVQLGQNNFFSWIKYLDEYFTFVLPALVAKGATFVAAVAAGSFF